MTARQFIIAAVLVATLSASVIAHAVESLDFSAEKPRVWTAGGKKGRATLIGYGDYRVTLRTEEGKEHLFGLEKLSASDRTYLKKNFGIELVAAVGRDAASLDVTKFVKETPITAPFERLLRSSVTADRVVGATPDGISVLTWNHRNEATLWRRDSGEIIAAFSGAASGNQSIAVSPLGNCYAASSNNSNTAAAIYDLTTGDELVLLEGHTRPVGPIAFNRDGTLLATGGEDNLVFVWDVATGKEVAKLEGHTARVTAVAFHPKGGTLLSGSYDETARLWNIKSQKASRTLTAKDIGGPVSVVAFADDGNVAAVISVGTVILWATPQVDINTTATSSSTSSSSGIGGGTSLKSVLGDDAKATVIAPTERSVPREATFDSVAFGHLGEYLLLATKAGTAICSDVVERQHIRNVERLASGVVRVAFGNTQYVTGSFDDSSIIWDAATGDTVTTLPGHNYGVSPIVFAADGRLTLTSGGWNDTAITLRSTATGEVLRRFEGHPSVVLSMQLSNDGLRLFSLSADLDKPLIGTAKRTKPLTMTMILWDTSTGAKLIEKSGIDAAAMSPNGRMLLSASGRQTTGTLSATVTGWNTVTGASLGTNNWLGVGDHWLLDNAATRLIATNVVPEDDRAAGTLPAGAFFRNVKSGELGTSADEMTYDTGCYAWSHDGRRLFTGVCRGDTNLAELWNHATPSRPIVECPHKSRVLSVACSPDGVHLLTGALDGEAILWKIEEQTTDGRKRFIATPAKTFSGTVPVVGVGFAESGKYLLVGREDGQIVAERVQ